MVTFNVRVESFKSKANGFRMYYVGSMSLINYDEICGVCIGIMKWWSAYTGISYGTINVVLFIILNPLYTLLASVIAIINAFSKSKRLKLVLSAVLILMLVLAATFVFYFVTIPLAEILS